MTEGIDTPVDDETALAAALAGLLSLVTDRGDLAQLLAEISNLTLLAVPGADGVGVTAVMTAAPDTLAASANFVREVDDVQYRVGEGPCISAASEGLTNHSGALAEDASWPTFGPMAAALGINSALSLPLLLRGEVLGALNVYAYARDAFTDAAREIGERFAGPAAVAVYNARAFDNAKAAAARMEAALGTRAVIDQAIGIIRARSGLSADEAFQRLRIISQHEHTKLRTVAANLVDEATRRVHAQGQRYPHDD